MSDKPVRPSAKGTLERLLFTIWVVFGTHLINRYVFNYQLPGVRLCLLMALVVLSAYPAFGWRRNSPWERVGRWTFPKWVAFAVALWLLATALNLLISIVLSYLVM
jgi:hypothetical protein